MTRMYAATVAILLLAATPDAQAALHDRQNLPVADWPYLYYFSTASAPGDLREEVAASLKFAVPSLSAKSRLEDQIPVKVGATLYRIDTRGLGWEATLPKVLLARYPYLHAGHPKGYAPICIDATWFVAEVLDQAQTGDAQQLLLYGKALKNIDEFRKAWRVQNDARLNFGLIEGKSGVAVQRTRLIENNASGNRGYSFVTFDSRIAAGKNDPLETLTTRPPKHDASELIAAIYKTYAGKSGALQAYLLANGKGEVQVKAPADIVTDTSGVRGVEIRNSASCIACHVEGIRHPTLDQYRAYILSGARIFADKYNQQEIDRYHASDLAKEIRRANEDYAAGVNLCNHLTPEENAAAFIQTVHLYDAPVTLAQAAREVYLTERELQLALGDYSRRFGLTGRLAMLTQGEPITREQFKANWYKLQEIIVAWSAH